MGLLTAALTRALALHSRQGREPLRGNCLTGTSCPLLRSRVFEAPARGPWPMPILAVGAEALPVTPSGGALFAS